MTEDVRGRRRFTARQEPPLGERIALVNPEGTRITWTGKRWCERGYERDLQVHDSWPPRDYDGPWWEVLT